MNVTHLLTQTATIALVTFDGPADSFGDPTPTTSTVSFKCWLSQTQRSEVSGNQDVQQETWSLYLEPAAAEVDGFDRVTVDDIAYELYGPPWPALNPRAGLPSHVECTVKRIR